MKTSELIGPALDNTITQIELGRAVARGEHVKPWVIERIESGEQCDPYSTDWMWGGPIIDREDITVGPWDTSPAMAQPKGWPSTGHRQVGPTKLIAAMRCYAASVLGDEVNIPKELL